VDNEDGSAEKTEVNSTEQNDLEEGVETTREGAEEDCEREMQVDRRVDNEDDSAEQNRMSEEKCSTKDEEECSDGKLILAKYSYIYDLGISLKFLNL
jgi:hypothetical protein